MFRIVKSISLSCVNFCDCSNQLKKASANCLMESKVKLTSLGVEADEVAAVAVVDGFGGGGVNVGILNSSFLNTPCRVFPKHASNLFLRPPVPSGTPPRIACASPQVCLRTGCRWESHLPWSKSYHRPLRPMNSDLTPAESPKSMLTQNWSTHKH